METSAPIKLAIVAGEQSGQLLATDLIKELARVSDRPIDLIGVGGTELSQMGLESLFDPNEIAITGISGVVTALPRLLSLVSKTADVIIEARPDCLLLVDSPEFSLRVAKRVKAVLPDTPIIKYVAPTVWGWRPDRAAKMREYIDHVLAILPFEPEVMARLNGPDTHYVGHRLIDDEGLQNAWRLNAKRQPIDERPLNLLVLPGSRKGEIISLMEPFKQTVEMLVERGHTIDVTIPTLPRHRQKIRDLTWDWAVTPTIVETRQAQIEAYSNADAALAASGTVTLELALAGVPAISCYKLDPLMKLATSLITAWSGALPNLIADQPIIREFYNEQVRPGMLARCIEQLSHEPMRSAVLEGYDVVRRNMTVDENPSTRAANIVLSAITQK